MLNPPATSVAASIEECVDELDQFVVTLERYPETVLAFAMRVHLAALLRAMVENQVCSRGDVRQFLFSLEHEALGVGEE